MKKLRQPVVPGAHLGCQGKGVENMSKWLEES